MLTDETKYFLSNRVPGQDGWSLRTILRVTFGRWPIEDCFREAKEELGFDHFECRGWTPSEDVFSGELLTTEQVRRAANAVVGSMDLPSRLRRKLFVAEASRQLYYAQRNAQAARSHHKTRHQRLLELGINLDKIKIIFPKPPLKQ